MLSTIATNGGSPHPADAAYIFCHISRGLQRLNQVNRVVLGPFASGMARQRSPSRKTVQYAADNPKIVHTWSAAKMRQERINRSPLPIVQPEEFYHDPSPPKKFKSEVP